MNKHIKKVKPPEVAEKPIKDPPGGCAPSK